MRPRDWLVLCCAFSVSVWRYGLTRLHCSDFLFYTKTLPLFWGLDASHPTVAWLWHNGSGMALTYRLLNQLALPIAQKIVVVNLLNISVQALNVGLVACVFRLLVGAQQLVSSLLLWVLYPFGAANRYWQICLTNNLALTLCLLSVIALLSRPRRWWGLGLSVSLLWLSILMQEYALTLSPVYGYWLWRFWKRPYRMVGALLFLLTSLLPLVLFSGHRLTVFAYGLRYQELHLLEPLIIAGNALLTATSYLLANTLGWLVYPLSDLVTCRLLLPQISLLHGLGILLVAGLGLRVLQASPVPTRRHRHTALLGLGWMGCAYLPFTLSFGYPRNVGLLADRVNLLGAVGSVLLMGSGLSWLRAHATRKAFGVVVGLGLGLLGLNLELQQLQYRDAEQKMVTLESFVHGRH